MRSLKNIFEIQFAFAVVLSSLCLTSRAQYDDSHYRVTEDGELLEDDEAPKKNDAVDYTKYFNGAARDTTSVGILGSPNDATTKDDSAGFVEPIDFSSFVANNFGGLETAGASTPQMFTPPAGNVQFASPLASIGFPNLEASASNANHSIGFINPNIDFQSMFDAAGSATDAGFRPQDFLPQDNRGGDTRNNPYGLFFTPSFAALREDVDKDYEVQRKEVAALAPIKSDKKRPSTSKTIQTDYDDGSDTHDDFRNDDYEGIDTHDTSPKKYTSKPSKSEKSSYRPTYGTVHKASEARPTKPSYEPSTTSAESDYGYGSPFEYSDGPFKGDDVTENAGFTPEPKQVAPPHLGKSSHTSYSKPLPLYHKVYASGSYNDRTPYPQPKNFRPKGKAIYKTSTKPVYSKKPAPSTKQYPGHGDLNPYHDYSLRDDFKSSPSDPYLDSIEKPFPESSHASPNTNPTTLEDLYKLPQTDYATVIKKTDKQQQDTSETKKRCTKINKKVNTKDLGHRFRRQQMTCFLCKNPKTGGNYEECSYESEPKAKEYFEGSTESFSSGSSLEPFIINLRTKRGTSKMLKKHDAEYADTVRKIRQYDEEEGDDSGYHGGEEDSGSYYGPDSENYRFGPEYFTDDGVEEEGEETKSQQSSSAAASDENCKKVKKEGLICVVCNNPKTSGTYEQCSYASDPKSNKYEYHKSSRYGSPSPNKRDKRYIDEITEKKKNKKNNSFKRKYRQDESIEDLQSRGDFKYGKLKRKKVGKSDHVIPETSGSLLQAETTKFDNREGLGLDPFLYGSPDTSHENANKNSNSDDGSKASATSVEDDEEPYEEGTYEDYFYRLFPELEPKSDKGDDGSGEEKDDESSSAEGEVEDEEDLDAYFKSLEDEEPTEDQGGESEESEGEEEAEGEVETKQSKKKVKPTDASDDYFDVAENKKQIERVLGEFSQRDRKNCKKVIRDKMTCFQCIDKKGMQREECMFVAASAPKAKHLAYHEVKEFRLAPKDKKDKRKATKGSPEENLSKTGPATFESQDNLKVIDTKTESDSKEIESSKKKRKTDFMRAVNPTKVPVAVVTDNLSQSAEMFDILKTNPKAKRTEDNVNAPLKVLSRKKRLPESDSPNIKNGYQKRSDSHESETRPAEDTEQNTKVRKNYNSIPPEPGPFEIPEGPEGAYSDETEPVYDKVLKMRLPKYMLMKSEHEEEFDEVMASG